jgi:hypothetical protein
LDQNGLIWTPVWRKVGESFWLRSEFGSVILLSTENNEMKPNKYRTPSSLSKEDPLPKKNRSLRRYIEALERKAGRRASDISLEEVRAILKKVGPLSPLITEMRHAR